MYKCTECGLVFEEPKEYVDDCTPGGAFEGMLRHYIGCPCCEGAFEEIEEEEEDEGTDL